MSAAPTINFANTASPALNAFIGGLADRRGLHEAIALSAAAVVRDYLIGLAGTRHDTATRLGAAPSGHLAEAAERTHSSAAADRWSRPNRTR